MSDRGRLQPGIAFERGSRPKPCYRLLLLNIAPGTTPSVAHAALAAVDNMLAGLAAGEVRELAGQPEDKARASAEQFEGLEHLIGFGRRMFDPAAHDPPVAPGTRPDYLAYLPADGPFPSLRWAPEIEANRGEADIAVQFTADRAAAVNCAAVEVWKLIADGGLPLTAKASFDGFSRHDGRGWLEFHDGVSNMHSSQRRAAIEAPADPEWMEGGTYMAFLRLAVDLAAWRSLTRAEQELAVGRDKLSGAALVRTEAGPQGDVVPVAAAPLPEEPDDLALGDFLDPPQSTDPVVERSHVHRANQLRGSPLAVAAMRMFRQGYEFLDDIAGQPRLGLNFVSFQRDLGVLHHVLHLPGWLGDVNFGGDKPLRLLTVLAGGLYAVPPAPL